jgi:ferritin-like metal-binding protein YciE
MATVRERLVQWLRDAHAAEEQSHTMMKKTAQQLEGEAPSEFRAGLERHAELSAGQARRLEECLERLGESTSAVKKMTGQITALGQTMSGYLVGDEPVKAVLAVSSFARMEAASYRILVCAAETARLDDVAALCRTLLDEETEFARWVEQQIEPVTREYLRLQAAEA